jgi:hypothetical protein
MRGGALLWVVTGPDRYSTLCAVQDRAWGALSAPGAIWILHWFVLDS